MDVPTSDFQPGDIGPNLNTDKSLLDRGGAVPRPGFRNVRRRGSYIVKTRGSAIVDRGFATNNARPNASTLRIGRCADKRSAMREKGCVCGVERRGERSRACDTSSVQRLPVK
jgi:hypothetical protein